MKNGSKTQPTTSDSTEFGSTVQDLLTSRYRCEANLAEFSVAGDLSERPGYFRIGSQITCYGRCSSELAAKASTDPFPDVQRAVTIAGSGVQIPFDPMEIVDNLRSERFTGVSRGLPMNKAMRGIYYATRNLMPNGMRKHLQRFYFRRRTAMPVPAWPVDRTVENIFEHLLSLHIKSRKVSRVPFIWFWPEGIPAAAIMTHDVETSTGVDFCSRLMDMDDSFGIKSSFQIVPERRYSVRESFLQNIRQRGFEINVHDLNHDGHLFADREQFLDRAGRINEYGRQFLSRGFRAAAMYRNVDWYDALDFDYDMSIPNVAQMEPQDGGCCTVLPFFIGNILELPMTAAQDYSLFAILNDYSIRLWKQQISMIQEKHGLISFCIHPDYLIDDAAQRVYAKLLGLLSELRSHGSIWVALPSEMDRWWRLRSKMNLIDAGGKLRIEGEGSERARIAYAVLVDDKLTYQLTSSL
jgi:hypothetical protein